MKDNEGLLIDASAKRTIWK